MTGRELLEVLQAHSDWLELDVVLIAPDFVDTDEGILRTVELDRFEENEPMVICLDTHPTPASGRGITSSMFSDDTRRDG